MSPIEYIADGIRNGNWKVVCKGYEKLTGQILPPPTTKVMDDAEKALLEIYTTASIALEVIPQLQTLPVEVKQYPDEIPPRVSSKVKRDRPNKKRKKKMKPGIKDGEDTTLILDGQINTPVTQESRGTQLITNDPSSKEIEVNKIKAAKAEQNKVKLNRQTPHVFDVTCNECEETFKSDRPDGELGQKCRRCLRARKK